MDSLKKNVTHVLISLNLAPVCNSNDFGIGRLEEEVAIMLQSVHLQYPHAHITLLSELHGTGHLEPLLENFNSVFSRASQAENVSYLDISQLFGGPKGENLFVSHSNIPNERGLKQIADSYTLLMSSYSYGWYATC